MFFFVLGTFIPYYGFFIVIGTVCAILLGFFICKKNQLNTDDFIIICAYLISFGFLGAKILYLVVSFEKIDFSLLFKNPKLFNKVLTSGFVFYGGFIGGILSLLIVRIIHKINTKQFFNCIVPGLGIAHGFGRIGCSFAGCCFGKETSGFLYYIYTNNSIAPNNIKLFPVQGVEAFFLFTLGLTCTILVLKNSKFNCTFFYIISYSIIRFFLEYFRGDKPRGFISIFSTSQFISLLLILISIIVLIVNYYVKKHSTLVQQ